MTNLTADDFCADFNKLVKSLDYRTLRHSSANQQSSFAQIISFSLKWKLAFNQFRILDELNIANEGQKERLRNALQYFTKQLAISEKEFYKNTLKGFELENAYPLSKKTNWSLRLINIFKINELKDDNAIKENIHFFVNLLTILSDLLNFKPE